jgi:signal transduction histidine kinase
VSDHLAASAFGPGLSHRLRDRWTAAHQSVFAKLLAIMVAMAACLLLLVSLFFWLAVGPILNTTIHQMTQPDAVAGHSATHAPSSTVPRGTTASTPNEVHTAHAAAFVVLLLIMVAVVLSAHAVLKRLLQPLRALNDGVARLSAGQLDVVLPSPTRDEFGTLTDAFNQMVGRVRDMVGSRDQLLRDVSHELRSPVTRMKVALELLPDGEQRKRMAADVAEMEQMIAELLEFERLRDPRGIRTAPQDLKPLLREVAERFQNRAPGVRIASLSPQFHVDIDEEKVRIVLRNLIENAAKYSLPTSRPIEISASQNSETVVVRVTDDGVGIPESDVEHVFEPFFRVDRSRAKSSGGYGLGLSICKRVMEAHGGSIAVERQVGRGTSFILRFPKAAFIKSA